MFKYYKKEESGELQRVGVFIEKEEGLFLCQFFDLIPTEEEINSVFAMDEISISEFQDIANKYKLLNKIELEDY